MLTIPVEFETLINEPFHGDWLDFAKLIPDKSVHLAVTSPPYWRQRNYGVEPSVWRDDPSCEHVWGKVEKGKKAGRLDVNDPASGNFGGWKSDDDGIKADYSAGQYCEKDCGAWLGCLGLEKTPWEYIVDLADCFDPVYRVLRDDSWLAVNLGDCYASGSIKQGSKTRNFQSPTSRKYGDTWTPDQPTRQLTDGLKQGDLIGIPFLFAFEMRRRGWYWKQDIVWAKRGVMAEPVRDRCVRSHEFVMIFYKSGKPQFWTHRRKGLGARSKPEPDYIWRDRLEDVELTEEPLGDWRKTEIKNPDRSAGADEIIKRYSRINLWQSNKYFWDGHIIREPTYDKKGKIIGWHNKYDVWHISTASVKEAHFAPFPPDLINPLIKVGTSTWGCCGECAAPYFRLIDDSEPDLEGRRAAGGNSKGEYHMKTPGKGYGRVKQKILKSIKKRNTLRWFPTCECDTEKKIRGCIVLDPFAGSFTTAMAATNNGRRWLSCDISGKFVEIGERRLGKDEGPSVKTKKGVLWS